MAWLRPHQGFRSCSPPTALEPRRFWNRWDGSKLRSSSALAEGKPRLLSFDGKEATMKEITPAKNGEVEVVGSAADDPD